MEIARPVRYLKSVGPLMASRLEKLNIRTIKDLLYHLPFRYDDFTVKTRVSDVRVGETVTISGFIKEIKNVFTKHGKRIQEGIVQDDSGQISLIWFNQMYLTKILHAGIEISLSGKVDFFGQKKALISPEYEIISPENKETLHTGRLVPVYPETKGISSKWIRKRINDILSDALFTIEEALPDSFLKAHDLMPIAQAIKEIHFPTSQTQASLARRRLAFEELLAIQLSVLERKRSWSNKESASALKIDRDDLTQFIQNLPFSLTSSQITATKEILDDMTKKSPMNRLLEGDTGSGKTVVAAIAAYETYKNKLKAIFMAPTEILANQHAATLKALLSSHGVRIGLLTASHKPTEGDYDVLVGTQALLFRDQMENVALLVIDEQHRFGVSQRALLTKGKLSPHILTMTATPIPRTVALTFFGDLDLSIIDQMPIGRKLVKTYIVPPEKRSDAFVWVKNEILTKNTQAFIIYPLIEESETLSDVRAATKEYAQLSESFFKDVATGLLHGQMKSKEKSDTLEHFSQGEIKVLVATPVVEVGIDVPNATIMVIEGAERFGLAQLHQLRGRVGRSDKTSSCLILTQTENELVLKRLSSLRNIYSGAALAEIDLKLRGPGEIYGLRQHGFPELKAADLNDQQLMLETKEAAKDLIDGLDQLPALRKSLESYKIDEVSPN